MKRNIILFSIIAILCFIAIAPQLMFADLLHNKCQGDPNCLPGETITSQPCSSTHCGRSNSAGTCPMCVAE